MSNSNQITRPHAALIHLSVSVAISAALFCFFYFVWYPSQLLRAVGGLEIFIVLLCVDTILGPLMTFVVYKPGKRWLKLDLTIICTLQFLALIYGVSTLYAGRPVYIAALGHRFDVVQANEVESIDSQDALPELPIWGPVWVGTRRPSAPAERERAINAALAGADIGHFPRYHQPLADMRDEILRGASPISDLKKFNLDRSNDIDQWLIARGHTSQDSVFQGLRARHSDMAVMIDAKTGNIIGIAPFRPWE